MTSSTNQLQEQITDLETSTDHDTTRTRSKREVFTPGSDFLKWLFGTPSFDDAHDYNKKFAQLMTKQQKQNDLNQNTYLLQSHLVDIAYFILP